MEFVPQPEEAKKFGSMKWLKWHLFKYPHVFIVFSPVPVIIYRFIHNKLYLSRGMRDGTYVPNVIFNRYAIARSDDWLAENTPKRYHN